MWRRFHVSDKTRTRIPIWKEASVFGLGLVGASGRSSLILHVFGMAHSVDATLASACQMKPWLPTCDLVSLIRGKGGSSL